MLSEANSGQQLLAAEGLSVGPGRSRADVLSGVSLSLRAGELVAVVGPNGAGKSSLLRTLAGLQPPLAGTVRWGEHPLKEWPTATRARHAAVVLTEPAGDALLTVAELVALGRAPHRSPWGASDPLDTMAVTAAMTQAGVAALADRRVGRLSDGQRQRARLARALAQGTPLLLLDEPTLHLDPHGRASVLALLRALADGGRGVVVVTHEVDLAAELADCLWAVKDGRMQALAPAQWRAEAWEQHLFAGVDAR